PADTGDPLPAARYPRRPARAGHRLLPALAGGPRPVAVASRRPGPGPALLPAPDLARGAGPVDRLGRSAAARPHPPRRRRPLAPGGPRPAGGAARPTGPRLSAALSPGSARPRWAPPGFPP